MKMYSKIEKISNAISTLSFDQQVNMPLGGAEYRGEVIEELSMQIAKTYKSKKFLSLLDKSINEVTIGSDEHLILKDIEEGVKFSNRIPLKLQSKITKLQIKCNVEWEKVKTKKSKNDSAYLKVLGSLITAIKESIKYANQGEYPTNYDYLLASYSKGFTSENIEKVFSNLKPFVVDTLKKFESCEEATFDLDKTKLEEVCIGIANDIVGDKNKDNLKLQISTHPFCTTLGVNDVRITTRNNKGKVLDSIGSVVHESGHATYELGLDKKNYGNVLGSAASIACHEGISLFYEKHIGESDEMISRITKDCGFSEYDEYVIKDWMRGVDAENPIRTESDEITYQLHIINRFIIEKEIFNDDLKVEDIPKRWNELYGKEFTPDIGYAQDVHWSHASFGYFPSYTLGHLIGAQLRNSMEKDITLFKDGNINYDEIRNWLYENYFKHGGRYKSDELVKIATGEELNHEYWIKYITKKFNLEGK